MTAFHGRVCTVAAFQSLSSWRYCSSWWLDRGLAIKRHCLCGEIHDRTQTFHLGHKPNLAGGVRAAGAHKRCKLQRLQQCFNSSSACMRPVRFAKVQRATLEVLAVRDVEMRAQQRRHKLHEQLRGKGSMKRKREDMSSVIQYIGLQTRATGAYFMLVATIVRTSGGCTRAVFVRALKGLALPQAWNTGDVSPPAQSCWSDSRTAAPVLFAHAVVTVFKNRTSAIPTVHSPLVAREQEARPAGLCGCNPHIDARQRHERG